MLSESPGRCFKAGITANYNTNANGQGTNANEEHLLCGIYSLHTY